MATEWRETTLGEVTTWTSGGTPSKSNPAYWGGGIPWISAVSMKSGRLESSDRTLTEEGLVSGSRLAPKDSVLLLVRGSELHKRIPVGIATRDVAFNQDVKALRAREGLEPHFLYYWLAGNESLLLSKVEPTGIGAGKLETSVLKSLPLRLPPLAEQRAIAHILGTLDDKIELNRKQNETLEAMARALFKAWFVDFEPVRAKMEGRWQRGQSLPGLPAHLYDLFPDRLVESELGEIPEGWEVKSFADTVEIIGGGTPKTSVAEYWGGDIPWFSVVDAPPAPDVWVLDTEKKITHAGVENSSTRILPVGTTIISARGTVGRLALVGVPMAMNQSCYGLRGKLGHRGFFNYFTTRQLVSTLQHRTHGSVFDTITRDTLAGAQVVAPPLAVVETFERLVAPALDRIREALFESRSLATTRNTLLPKLISGELRVPDVDKFMEAMA